MAIRPMTRIYPRVLCTDPEFTSTPAAATDVTRTFDRARAEIASGSHVDWPLRLVVETNEPFIEA